jgi:hypothetical protein
VKWYEAAGIGIIVGMVYGILLWFTKSQLIFIYSQPIAFSVYYDPNLIAFTGASISAIFCLLIIFSYEKIYEVFENIALRYKEDEDE